MAQADTRIALQGQTANYMLPSEALSKAYALKNQKIQSDMAAQEMTDNALMDQAYRAAGGDISKMQADPNMGFRGGMQIAKMQADRAAAAAQADKEQAAADKLRLQSGIEKLNYGSQLLSGATPENWSQIRAEFGQMTGQDLGEQFDPAKVQSLMQQGLSMKDKLSNEWKQKGYELNVAQFGEQQRHNRTSEGISYMNAQNRGESSGKPQNLVWDASRGVFVDPNTRTFIAPTGQDGSSALPQKPVKQQSLTAPEVNQENKIRSSIALANNMVSKLDSHLANIESGVLDPGATNKAQTFIAAKTGYFGNDNTTAMANLERDAAEMRDAILAMEPGVKTDQDAERAYQRILTSKNDKSMLKASLENMKSVYNNAMTEKQLEGEAIRRNRNLDVIDYSQEYKSKQGSNVSGNVAGQIPNTNAKGWILHTDAQGNKAYVSPNGEIEEVR